MDKENKQTEQLLEQWAAQIQPPELHTQFCNAKKRKAWLRQKWLYVVGASILTCVVALAIWLPSLQRQVPPVDEPPKVYYWATLNAQVADMWAVDDFCNENSVPYVLSLTYKDDLVYSILVENDSQNILGVKHKFVFLSDAQYYECILTILSNKVADAKSDYQNLNQNIVWKENTVAYKYCGFIDSLFLYKAAFEKNGYVYLIDYSSIEEDFESGLATIFQ